MDKQHETLAEWLREAHDMELANSAMLERQARRSEWGDPEVQGKLTLYQRQTEGHAQALKECIERLGGPAHLSDPHMGLKRRLLGAIEQDPAEGEVTKTEDDISMVQSAIAKYTSIVAAARAIGDTETAMICDGILAEKREMATWFEEHLPAAAREFIEREK